MTNEAATPSSSVQGKDTRFCFEFRQRRRFTKPRLGSLDSFQFSAAPSSRKTKVRASIDRQQQQQPEDGRGREGEAKKWEPRGRRNRDREDDEREVDNSTKNPTGIGPRPPPRRTTSIDSSQKHTKGGRGKEREKRTGD